MSHICPECQQACNCIDGDDGLNENMCTHYDTQDCGANEGMEPSAAPEPSAPPSDKQHLSDPKHNPIGQAGAGPSAWYVNVTPETEQALKALLDRNRDDSPEYRIAAQLLGDIHYSRITPHQSPRCPKCGARMLAMRDRLVGVSVACSGKETHFFELKKLEEFAQFFPVSAPASQPSAHHVLITCLEEILARGECECEHDENCCIAVGEYCPSCLAAVALKAYRQSERFPIPPNDKQEERPRE